uniref:conserved oligomeric Golgi complex subunit 2-like n=1 Tax=Styela clava TaxID=7725 RepID=UPI0019395789|nr:conserved oligomeric Golgi complex subunit 2-like [Styela clava]
MESSKSTLLPMAPSTLCFDKNEFMNKDFSVDKFVADCRRRVQLETLRQDLEVYFKLLKNAMIELINKDYADFVNLSSNLVGMDKAIAQLRDPLTQIKDDMTQIRDLMENKIDAVESLLKRRCELTDSRDKLLHMIKLLRSVEKIEQIQSSEDTNSGLVLERIAGEFNELQHHAGFCKGLPVLSQVRPRISEITGNLQQRLEQLLILGVNSSDVALLHKCLNSYSLIGKTKDAENLVQVHLVRPYMHQVIEEQCDDISPKKVKEMFTKIVDFIPNYCKLLNDITAGRLSKVSDQYRGVSGYDFVVRSVWPEIVKSIENNLSTMFSPGYPDTFHSRYNLYMEFIADIERQCGSQASVQRLRQSEEFARFQSHWSLPVYFQMRFQEIGGKMEEALGDGLKDSSEKSLKLHASATLISCIEMCWKADIFLPPLVHRFWKVTLQCVARYNQWVKKIFSQPGKEGDGANAKLDVAKLVGLTCDLTTLGSKINQFYKDVIFPKVSQCGMKDTTLLQGALDTTLKSFETQGDEISQRIVATLTAQSIVHLRYAQDVPRLFRRTNRETPTKPSAYVSSVLKSIVNFRKEHLDSIDSDIMNCWLTESASNISEKYFTVVSDVLMSVKKMEESLMRLQKMRAGKSSGNLASLDDKKLSDDDKIRQQLYLDVVSLNQQLKDMLIHVTNVSKLKDLLELVTEAKPKDITAS